MIEVHPAVAERFDDVAAILAPRNPDAPSCWCLSYRVPNAEFHALRGPERPARLRRYAEEGTGLVHHLLTGAIGYARSQGAPMLEAYPVDSGAGRISASLPAADPPPGRGHRPRAAGGARRSGAPDDLAAAASGLGDRRAVGRGPVIRLAAGIEAPRALA